MSTESTQTAGIAFPGESAEYRIAREKLLQREIEHRRATEALAAARRELPPGGVVPSDYVFHGPGVGGTPAELRLSQLFANGHDTVIVYSFMFGPEREEPCPGCTSLLDQLDGAAPMIRQRASFVVVAESPLPRLLDLATRRGWRHLALLSTAGNGYIRAYHGQTPDGFDQPMVNVFQRDGEEIRHFWGSEMVYQPPDEGQDPRAAGTLEPLWNMLDRTPAGRGTAWYPDLNLELSTS